MSAFLAHSKIVWEKSISLTCSLKFANMESNGLKIWLFLNSAIRKKMFFSYILPNNQLVYHEGDY